MIHSFDAVESSFAEDKLVQIVSDICGTQLTEMDKARCVVNYYENKYVFVEHNGLKPASQFIEEGGVCRDFAVNVCTTLELMNISCSYVIPPDLGHVFPVMKIGNGYCTYDNAKWMCNSLI